MTARRVCKSLAAALLGLGLVGFLVPSALEAAGKQEEAKKYTEQLKTAKDAKKKVEALEELGKLAQVMRSLVSSAVPDIKESLKDKNADVRAAAAYAYGRTGPDPKEAVPTLVQMLKEDSAESVKMAAAKGLGAMGPDAKEAVKDLNAVIQEERKKDMKKQTQLGRTAGDARRAITEQMKKN